MNRFTQNVKIIYKNHTVYENVAQQSARKVVMVSPQYFDCNQITALSNVFQNPHKQKVNLKEKVLFQWQSVKKAIQNKGIIVNILNGPEGAPDAIFPNWFTTFSDKTMDIFSMEAPNRRIQKTEQSVSELTKQYTIKQDFRKYQHQNKALQSTSSLVLDRVHKIAYCSLSSRCHQQLADKWAKKRGFQLLKFNSAMKGKPIYHTNVVMWIGSKICAFGGEVCQNRDQIKKLEQSLTRYRRLVRFNQNQIANFCGNMLQMQNHKGQKYLLMSKTAKNSLDSDQIKQFNESFDDLIIVDIENIQIFGGGSARCLIQQLY